MNNIDSYDYAFAVGETYHLPDYTPFDVSRIPVYQQIGGMNHMKGGSVFGLMKDIGQIYLTGKAIWDGANYAKDLLYPQKQTSETVLPKTTDHQPVFTTKQPQAGEEYPGDALLNRLKKKFGKLDTMDNRKVANHIINANRNNPEYKKWLKIKNHLNDPKKLKEFKIEVKQEMKQVNKTMSWDSKTVLKGLAALGVGYMATKFPAALEYVKNNPQILKKIPKMAAMSGMVNTYGPKVNEYIKQYGPKVKEVVNKYGPEVRTFAKENYPNLYNQWEKYEPVLNKLKIQVQPYIKSAQDVFSNRWNKVSAPKQPTNPDYYNYPNQVVPGSKKNQEDTYVQLVKSIRKKKKEYKKGKKGKGLKGMGKKRKVKKIFKSQPYKKRKVKKQYLKKHYLKNIIDKLI